MSALSTMQLKGEIGFDENISENQTL